MENWKDFLNLDLRRPSGLRAEDLESFLTGTPLAGLGRAFIEAEHRHGVNARYFCAHAVLESGWGTSRIARDKNNLFGFGAYDKDPYRYARSFDSWEECIDVVAAYVAANYLNPLGRYYRGPTLSGMNQNYATDPRWKEKIAQLMDRISAQVPSPQRVSEPEPQGKASAPEAPPEKLGPEKSAGSSMNPRVRKLFHLFRRKR